MSQLTALETLKADVRQFQPTGHACQRMAQRNVDLDEVYFILEHGKRLHRAGVMFVFLRRRDIPDPLRAEQRYRRLEGTTVVLSRRKLKIITGYRNRSSGLQRIRRKPIRSR